MNIGSLVQTQADGRGIIIDSEWRRHGGTTFCVWLEKPMIWKNHLIGESEIVHSCWMNEEDLILVSRTDCDIPSEALCS